MEASATAKIKISATQEIIDTISTYKKGLQFCIDTAWEHRIINNVKLHPFVYKTLRSYLPAQLAIACISQSCGMVKKAKSKPIINRVSVGYNFPRSASFKNNVLSIRTLKGRTKIPFTIPTCYAEYFTWKVCESLLRMDSKGRCFFLFVFSKDINTECSCFQNRVLGVDVGVNNLAVTSTKMFFGKQIKALRIKHDKFVSKLQSKGTKSATRHLRKLSGRWTHFMAWVNHNISKRIVGSVPDGSTIVIEDLSNIRKTARYNRWVHKWAFRQLQSFIEYKAIRKGCRVVYVNPAYTSKECSLCHNHLVRHSGFVSCSHCGFSLNADLNGSRNIAQRYMRNMCLAIVTMPIVSDYEGKGSFGTSASELRNNQFPKAESPAFLMQG